MILDLSKRYSRKFFSFVVTTSTILAAGTATNFLVLYPQTANAQEVSRGNGSVSIQLPNTGNQDDNWSCGPNSAARILAFYGHKINYGTVKSAINQDFILPPSVKVPAPTWKDPFRTRRVDIRTGTTPHALRDAMKKWEGNNVKLERKSDFSKLLRLLGEGKPVVALLRVGSIPPSQTLSGTWPAMHWVAITGFDGKNIYFTDTDGAKYQYSYDEFQGKWDWRVGSGFASEALYKNGVQSKTMIWVDRTIAAQNSSPSELIAQIQGVHNQVIGGDGGPLYVDAAKDILRRGTLQDLRNFLVDNFSETPIQRVHNESIGGNGGPLYVNAGKAILRRDGASLEDVRNFLRRDFGGK